MVHLVGKRQSWEFSCWARWNQNGWIVGANYLWLGCIQPGSVDLFSKFSLIFTKLITLPPSLIYLFLHESIFRRRERKTCFFSVELSFSIVQPQFSFESKSHLHQFLTYHPSCRPYMKTGIPSLNIPKTDPMDIDKYLSPPHCSIPSVQGGRSCADVGLGRKF